MYINTNSNMGWYFFSKDKSKVETDDEEQVIRHKHHLSPLSPPLLSPWRRRGAAVVPPWRRRGAAVAPPLPPLWHRHCLLCRRRCLLFVLLDAAAAATSLPPSLPSHHRCFPCHLCRAATAAAPPPLTLNRRSGFAAVFSLPPPPLPHSLWRRCRRPPPSHRHC